ADAASTSVVAVRRRPDSEADEAAGFATRRDRVLRAGETAASGHRAWCRHHRWLSDRDGRDVRALAGSGGGVRSNLPACVSLLETSGHPGGTDAAGRRRGDQGACETIARDW